MANFWIFFKNPLGTFFYIPKALSNCKVSEKSNERMSRYLRDVHTYIRTSIQFRLIYFPNKICIHCQYTCIITYSSVGSWAMMPCVSSYISLYLDLNLPRKPIQWFITKTEILPHRASSTCDRKHSIRTSISIHIH